MVLISLVGHDRLVISDVENHVQTLQITLSLSLQDQFGLRVQEAKLAEMPRKGRKGQNSAIKIIKRLKTAFVCFDLAVMRYLMRTVLIIS